MHDNNEYVFEPGGSTWGTTYEEALRPAATYRVVWCVITAVFAAYVINDIRSGAASGWHPSLLVTGVVHLVPALASGYIAARILTSRVWVQHSFEPGSTMYHRWVIYQTAVGRRSQVLLRSPDARICVSGRDPFGPRPGWKLTVCTEGQHPPFVVRTPWHHDLSRLLELLEPVVSGDPALVHDGETRALFGTGRRMSRRPNHPGR